MDYPDFTKAVDLIRESGGVPVLAHPGKVLDPGQVDLLASFAGRGVLGIEAYSGYHNPQECEYWRAAGEGAGLFPTCGSDFHGKIKPAIVLGGHGGCHFDEAAVAWLETAAEMVRRGVL